MRESGIGERIAHWCILTLIITMLVSITLVIAASTVPVVMDSLRAASGGC